MIYSSHKVLKRINNPLFSLSTGILKISIAVAVVVIIIVLSFIVGGVFMYRYVALFKTLSAPLPLPSRYISVCNPYSLQTWILLNPIDICRCTEHLAIRAYLTSVARLLLRLGGQLFCCTLSVKPPLYLIKFNDLTNQEWSILRKQISWISLTAPHV